MGTHPGLTGRWESCLPGIYLIQREDGENERDCRIQNRRASVVMMKLPQGKQ